VLWSQEQLVKACLAKESRKRRYLFLAFLKYPAIVAILFFLLKYQAIELWTLCLGIALVPAVISVKALGMALAKHDPICPKGSHDQPGQTKER